MKKLSACILTAILALSLTACGGGGKSQESSSQPWEKFPPSYSIME